MLRPWRTRSRRGCSIIGCYKAITRLRLKGKNFAPAESLPETMAEGEMLAALRPTAQYAARSDGARIGVCKGNS